MVAPHPVARILTVLSLLFFNLLLVAAANAQGSYSCANYTVFTINRPQAFQPIGSAINVADTVVGYYSDKSTSQPRGFVRRNNGTLLAYLVPGATNTYLYGINNFGTVV